MIALCKITIGTAFYKTRMGTGIAFYKTRIGTAIALIQNDHFNKLHRVCQQILTELLVCFHAQQI
jgi:hypothetical protein